MLLSNSFCNSLPSITKVAKPYPANIFGSVGSPCEFERMTVQNLGFRVLVLQTKRIPACIGVDFAADLARTASEQGGRSRSLDEMPLAL